MTTTLTSNEAALLEAYLKSEFHNLGRAAILAEINNAGSVWTFSVIDGSGLAPAVARGAISSLIQKGLARVEDADTRDSAFTVTMAGWELLRAREPAPVAKAPAPPVRYLTCAETAKLARATLKNEFPGTKFSVRSSVYAGGASINIDWMDGPAASVVDRAVGYLVGSDFDGMTDSSTPRPPFVLDGAPVRSGADFIFTNRRASDGPRFERLAPARTPEIEEKLDATRGAVAELAQFGVPAADVLAGFDEAGRAARADALLSGLSDVQELVAAGAEPERVRMALNRLRLIVERRIKPLVVLGERTRGWVDLNPLGVSTLNLAVRCSREAEGGVA